MPLKRSPLWGFPQIIKFTSCYTVAAGVTRKYTRRTSWGIKFLFLPRHLLSLLSPGSTKFHMTKDPSNVCLITEPRLFHSVSHPLQMSLRFFRHPTPDRQQHALRLACPEGRRNWVSTFHIVDHFR